MAPLIEAERWVSGHDIKSIRSPFLSSSFGLRMVSPHSFYGCLRRAGTCSFSPATTWTNRFLTKQRIITAVMSGDNFRPHFINNEPEPQAGSQMVSPVADQAVQQSGLKLLVGYRIPGFLPTAGGKVFDQIFVGITITSSVPTRLGFRLRSSPAKSPATDAGWCSSVFLHPSGQC